MLYEYEQLPGEPVEQKSVRELRHQAEADQCRANPGKWVLVERTDSPVKAKQHAYQITHGVWTAFKDETVSHGSRIPRASGFHAEIRKVDDRYELYAMFDGKAIR